jgi:acid phosphatase (class A)
VKSSLRLVFAAACAAMTAPVAAQVFVDAKRDGLVESIAQPPTPGSLAQDADLEAVLSAQQHRSQIEEYAASFDGELSASQWAQLALGKDYTPQRYPEAFALFDAVRSDMTLAVDLVKAMGPQRKRPHQQDDRVKPSLSIEGHGSNSWPSGRAAASRVWAGVLTDLFPERSTALTQAAERTAALRLIGGVHYPSDLAEGKRLADRFLAKLRSNPAYRGRLMKARQDMTAMPKRPQSRSRSPAPM